MIRSVVSSFAIVVLAVAALGAQAARGTQTARKAAARVPNFSGTWIVLSPEDEAGQFHVVKQTATEITVGNGSENGEPTAVYKLNGLGTREESRLQRENVPTVSSAAWKGSMLLITRETTLPGGRVQMSTQDWTIDSQGRLQIVFRQTLGDRELQNRTFIYRKDK